MGLEQGGKPLSGEFSADFNLHRSLGRLSWFDRLHPHHLLEKVYPLVDKIRNFQFDFDLASLVKKAKPYVHGYVAGTVGLVGAHTIPTPTFAEPLPQSAEQSISLNTSGEVSEVSPALDPLTLELSDMATARSLEASQLGIEDLTGELVTRAYVDPITGDRMLGFRNMVFKVGLDGKLKLILDQLDKINLQDPRLSMADPVPPRSQDPIIVDPAVQEYVTGLGKVLGIESPQVTGVLNTPSYEVFRLNNDLIFLRPSKGPNAGQFILGNAGWQAILTGGIGIPETAMLSPEQTATGGGTTPTPAETQQPIEVTPHSFELHYESPNGMFVIDNTDGPKGFRPTSDQALVEIENYMKQYGLKKLILTPNNTLIEGTREIRFFPVCGPTDPNCRTPYLYLRDLIVDRSTGEARWEYRWADTDLQLTPERLSFLQKAYLQTHILADAFIWFKYGPPFDYDNPKTNSDEAKNLSGTLFNAPLKLEAVIP